MWRDARNSSFPLSINRFSLSTAFTFEGFVECYFLQHFICFIDLYHRADLYLFCIALEDALGTIISLPCVIAAGTDPRCRSGPLVLGTRGSCLAAALGLPQEMPLLSKQGLCLEDVAFTAGQVVVISGEKHSCSMCLGSYCLFSPFLHFKLFYLIRGISSYYSRRSLK